ncbi:predicted protein [Aspergillus terreus NIH2624]|uniref:Uncharacterized protein n=1 Tax=Aspergillus terreus (strain NIH 2624 / FGSC A1156) TaxID=341663 RepID=Q0CZU7_ASPTN|nr:uncharacterized protein ATEG_00787 [Aspergillus terreus NIH2624]EAU39433.1 predicted protein [Aspergillus terreus NIH2624]
MHTSSPTTDVRPSPADTKRPRTPSTTFVSITENHRSVASSPTSPRENYDPTVGAKPYSPFYRHATSTMDGERVTINAKEVAGAGVYTLTELERQSSDESDNRRGSKLWAEKKRHCDCMRSMPTGQRIMIKAAIAVVTLGSMVAIALGITAAVGGGVWRSDHQQSDIG